MKFIRRARAALLAAICLVALFVPATASSSLGVDVNELKTAQKIQFIDYTGPIKVLQTDREIRAIGAELARQVLKGSMVAAFLTRYTAIHAVDTAEPDKFSADIILLNKDSRIDLIANVRRVTSAYLSNLYKYPTRDSDVLALLVTYYNALYRGNLSYFKEKYKTAVLSHLDKDIVGISTKYFDWPGKTQLVIPLNENVTRDIFGALNSSEISGKAVIEQLKTQENKGIPERKAIVELKQQEVKKGQAVVDQGAKQLAEQNRQTQQAQTEVEAARRAEEQAKTQQERKAAQDMLAAKETVLAQKQAAQQATEEKLSTQQAAVQEKQQEVAEEKKEIASDQAAQRLQQNPEQVKKDLTQKEAQLAQRETTVAAREEAVKKGQTDQAIFAGKLYYLKIKEYLSGGHYNNDMLVINAATGAVILKSTEAHICGRKFDLFKNGVVVITYKTTHNEGHYLTLLDLDTLQRKAISDEAVFFRSFVETRDEFTYVVVDKGSAYYLGKFSAEMKLVAISKDEVDPDSFISFFNDLVYINGKNKNILVLNKADLSTKSAITP
jgi:glucan-binding YG repeat protein